jgi:flagella basal body P-ring formation protein FlgA
MTKTILTLLFSAYVIASHAEVQTTTCAVEFYSKVYRLESNQSLNSADIVHKSTCDNLILTKLSQIISNSNGTVGADFLKRELAKEFQSVTIDITPRKFSLLELNTVLKEQLTNDTNLYVLDSKSLNGLKTLGLVEGEQLKANCENCNSFGEKNIKIDIANPILNSSRTLWFSSKIMAKIKIFKAKRNLSFQQKHLEASDFYLSEIYTSTPDNLVTSLENIHFFKVNKTIVQDAAVSNLDLQPVNLISFGTPVSVVLKNQNINLQKTAMPTRSALFGEVIELKNPNNNKMIAGKVVDYNKVVIEL